MSFIEIRVVDGKLVPFDKFTGRITKIPENEIDFLFAFAKGKDEEEGARKKAEEENARSLRRID